jgi:hypothetical protein
MAFLPALVGIVGAGAAVYQGQQQANAARFNAQVATNEQTIASSQALAQENLLRRSSREALGREAAAFGGAGVGYGGSSAIALDQSAINQEMDALNTRYKGTITGYGYGVQAQQDKLSAETERTNSGLLAGAALLKGVGSNYSYAPAQAGVTTPGGANPINQ